MAIKTLLLVTLLLGTAIAAGVMEGKPQAPFGEGKPVTFTSGALLLAIAWLSFQMHQARHVAPGRTFWKPATAIWRLMSFGFLYMAVDEVAQIHEFIDKAIHAVFRMQETGLSDRIDDVIVGLYGVIGIAGLWAYRQELILHWEALPFLVAGLSLFFLMVALDLLTNRQDILLLFFFPAQAKHFHTWLSVLEECLKLYAGACLFLAFYCPTRGVKLRGPPGSNLK